jgi:hypothetical protein
MTITIPSILLSYHSSNSSTGTCCIGEGLVRIQCFCANILLENMEQHFKIIKEFNEHSTFMCSSKIYSISIVTKLWTQLANWTLKSPMLYYVHFLFVCTSKSRNFRFINWRMLYMDAMININFIYIWIPLCVPCWL